MISPSTERFSSRVEAYVKYRPHYPSAVLQALQEKTGLTGSHIIADIGSGTGFSAELFAENGNEVFAIEPNKEMREAGERYLARYPNFHSINATAEETTLADSAVDYLIAGQAFHWFKFDEAYREFKRILRPNGWLVLLWNDRETDTTPFLIAYEKLLQDFGTDYNEINHRNIDAKRVREFFHGSPVTELQFSNDQELDYAGVEGRLLSSSYVPNIGEPGYNAMLARLHGIFDEHQQNGKVVIKYQTLFYMGQL